MMDLYVDLLYIFWKKFDLLADKSAFGTAIKSENILNKELSEELHKTNIRKFKKRKVHASFIDNIWGAGLVDMQLISKLNEGFRFLSGVIDIFGK